MANLENVYHNFPHLAKQSGFNFQLHRGRVNWCDIENLDINEIIDKRNFEILEKNLVNVTNCDLERENDFKILNQNFIKLFKLAQLGIDYLSYCEMYLDRCVVLLQEQLIASQEECELMKKEIQKRKLKNNKSRSKLNFQCEKCAKVFISDVYLKFHEKRRHSGKNVPENFDASPQNCSCNCSKSKSDKLSASTQTLFLEDTTTITQEETSSIKNQDLLKVEKLDHELQDLKERLEKAETKLSEKTEFQKPNACHSIDVPMHCSYMLMHLPSYFTHIAKDYSEINPDGQSPVLQVCQPNSVLSCSKNSVTTNSKSPAENMSELNCESKVLTERNCEVLVEERINSNIPDIIEDFQKYDLEAKSLENEKENVDPKIKANCFTNLIKPLPPPRKLKKGIQRQSESETTIAKIDTYVAEKAIDSNNHLIVRSTPVKAKQEETNLETFEESIENISEIDKSQANSIKSPDSKRSILFGSESRSFIKKMIKRDSSSIPNLNKTFKKSLNNLYCSVSSIEKEVTKKDRNYQTLRMSIVEKLNNHLQQLGINSEWSGIPKKSMRQKLSAWKHQRRFLSKENSLYPVIRQDIEEKIVQKLKNSFFKKKALLKNSSSKQQESVNSTCPETPNILHENELEFTKSGNGFTHDTETDFDSTVSDLENFHKNKVKHSQATIVVEEMTSSEETKNYDESNTLLFQARGSSLNNVTDEKNQKCLSYVKSDKLVTVSDIEISFSEKFDRKKSLEDELIIVNGSDTDNSESKNSSSSSHGGEMLKRKTRAF